MHAPRPRIVTVRYHGSPTWTCCRVPCAKRHALDSYFYFKLLPQQKQNDTKQTKIYPLRATSLVERERGTRLVQSKTRSLWRMRLGHAHTFKLRVVAPYRSPLLPQAPARISSLGDLPPKPFPELRARVGSNPCRKRENKRISEGRK